MSSKQSMGSESSPRRHRRVTAAVKQSLRDLTGQIALLNRQVGSRVGLKDVDLGCLELIARDGPLSPRLLARRAGLHPATLTGVLDRLERDEWIVRERGADPTDRRSVTVRALRQRNAELFAQYAGMNTAMDELCASYTEAELRVIADFLTRTAGAGRVATEDLAEE